MGRGLWWCATNISLEVDPSGSEGWGWGSVPAYQGSRCVLSPSTVWCGPGHTNSLCEAPDPTTTGVSVRSRVDCFPSLALGTQDKTGTGAQGHSDPLGTGEGPIVKGVLLWRSRSYGVGVEQEDRGVV